MSINPGNSLSMYLLQCALMSQFVHLAPMDFPADLVELIDQVIDRS